MKKVAKLVSFTLQTRVIVNENATDEDIISMSYPNIRKKLDNQELGENLEEIVDDKECPFGTLESDDPCVEVVLLSTIDKKYIVSGRGIPTQIIPFEQFSDWDSIKDFDGNAVLDCQIDYDDSVKMANTDKYYQFQTVDLVEVDGEITMGNDYRGLDEIELIVTPMSLSFAILEHSDKIKLKK